MPGPFGSRARCRKRAAMLLLSLVSIAVTATVSDPTDTIDGMQSSIASLGTTSGDVVPYPLTFDRVSAVNTPQCAAEDEVPVNLAEPAYGMAKGETVCVHIDNIKETKR